MWLLHSLDIKGIFKSIYFLKEHPSWEASNSLFAFFQASYSRRAHPILVIMTALILLTWRSKLGLYANTLCWNDDRVCETKFQTFLNHVHTTLLYRLFTHYLISSKLFQVIGRILSIPWASQTSRGYSEVSVVSWVHIARKNSIELPIVSPSA